MTLIEARPPSERPATPVKYANEDQHTLELIEKHLGQMPGVDEPARLACWVAGLINPIPALGVAYEIRPALLMATTVGDMIGVAHKGITLSIKGLKKSSGDVDAE